MRNVDYGNETIRRELMVAESWDKVEAELGNTTTVTAQSETTSTKTTVQRDSKMSSSETTSDRGTAGVFAQESDSEESEESNQD
jgi:hypothetical protein